MNSWENIFRDLYQQKNLMKGNNCLPLYEVCPRAQQCWKDNDHRIPDPNKSNDKVEVARPWVGKFFTKGGLVAIGENLRSASGGFRQHVGEVAAAKPLLREGKERIFGSYFHYALGVYSAKLLANMRSVVQPSPGRFPAPEFRASAFDYIAYLQHVKCFTNLPGGASLDAMWGNCEEFILQEELDLLDPSLLLVIGIGSNFQNIMGMLRMKGYQTIHSISYFRNAKLINMYGQGNELIVISVYHPNYRELGKGPVRIIEESVERLDKLNWQ